jgi:hypothetical protein
VQVDLGAAAGFGDYGSHLDGLRSGSEDDDHAKARRPNLRGRERNAYGCGAFHLSPKAHLALPADSSALLRGPFGQI